jgi:molecular chaperone GrpE
MSHPKRKCKEEEGKKDSKEVERSSASPRVDIESLTKELEERSKRANECLSSLQRVSADFENYKKRVEKEKAEWIKFANESLILDLIASIDNFERALKAANKNKEYESLRKGTEMIYKEMMSVLIKNGLEEIKALGENFDPYKHEAIEQIIEEDCEDGAIVEEYQKGYTLHSKVVRPSKVKVVKSKSDKKEVKK